MARSGLFRRGWLLVFLLAGLAAVALALIEAERSIRSNQAVVDRTLTAYARFAVWSYQEHVTEALRVAAQEVLGGVNMVHTEQRVPTAAELGGRLTFDSACRCRLAHYGPVPGAFLRFHLGREPLEVVPNGAAAFPLSPEDRAGLLSELTGAARAPISRWGYQVLITRLARQAAAFTLVPMPTRWGDTLVYAVGYSGPTLEHMLAATFDDPELLPRTIGWPGSNRDLLAAEVRDASGAVLFASGVGAAWRRDASFTLPSTYGALTIRMEIEPRVAGDIVIGGLPRSRLPLLLALLALAIGLTTAAAVQLRREVHFARDRADFIASTSHELRTPLTQIRIVIDMLRLGREKDPARREAALGLVDRELTRLQHLVDGVLRFTRGDSDREGPPVRSPVDVSAEARAVVDEFRPLAASRGVTIDLAAPEAPLLVPLEAGSLRQILLNLLDNAVKFGPDGQTVRVTVEGTEGGGVRLHVRDGGPGVTPSERVRIWRAFERGSAAAARGAGGSGIGLTVVRDIAQRHGGRTMVAGGNGGGAGAGAGAGAEFVVELPGEA